jgi:hypothetical protein
MEKEAKSCAVLSCHPSSSPCAESCVRTVKITYQCDVLMYLHGNLIGTDDDDDGRRRQRTTGDTL